METKRCYVCGEVKPITEFYKSSRNKDGFQAECKFCRKQWKINNLDKCKEYARRGYKKNRDKRLEYEKQWYKNNRDKILEYNKQWRINNPDKCKLYETQRVPSAKRIWSERVRNLVHRAFYHGSISKNSKTEEIIGCTFEELKAHLEQTWFDNYGTPYNGELVHIDHIIPLATAKTEEDVIRLSHYTNLQYLTPEDNLAKGSKLDWELSRSVI